jgi:hypothetical protein
MDNFRLTTEALIRLFQVEIDPHTVLVAADDVFEATDVPALLLQGPTPVEDGRRRTLAPWTERNQAAMTFRGGQYPRLYHLEFDLVASAGNERSLLTLVSKIAALYQRKPLLAVPDLGALPLTELTPLGGWRRGNLSNLRQASGRLRIEDCPVGDVNGLQTETGRLIGTPIIDIHLGGRI